MHYYNTPILVSQLGCYFVLFKLRKNTLQPESMVCSKIRFSGENLIEAFSRGCFERKYLQASKFFWSNMPLFLGVMRNQPEKRNSEKK